MFKGFKVLFDSWFLEGTLLDYDSILLFQMCLNQCSTDST